MKFREWQDKTDSRLAVLETKIDDLKTLITNHAMSEIRFLRKQLWGLVVGVLLSGLGAWLAAWFNHVYFMSKVH